MEECVKRIMMKKDVLDVIFIDLNGHPVKSTMDYEESIQYIGLFGQLIDKARSAISSLNTGDEVTLLRIRSEKHEVIITPDKELIFLVLQNPQNDR